MLARLSRPGDVVVTTGWWLLDVRYALGARAGGLRWLTFPASSARHPGWYDDRVAEAATNEAAALARRLAGIQASGHTVWMLRSPVLASDRLLAPAAGACGLVPVASAKPYWVLWGPARRLPGNPG
ncbi:MAG: hypothetical protein GXP48_10765 [Acidobacteria bacterium]|nr:hypothetical protein [Acidobacteriota bacterium]